MYVSLWKISMQSGKFRNKFRNGVKKWGSWICIYYWGNILQGIHFVFTFNKDTAKILFFIKQRKWHKAYLKFALTTLISQRNSRLETATSLNVLLIKLVGK